MTERKSRRRGHKKVCAQEPKQREQMTVEIVFGDPDETQNPDAPADVADKPGQNGSPHQSNRVVFRF